MSFVCLTKMYTVLLIFILVKNDKKQSFVYRPKWWFIFVWWASDYDRFFMHILVVVAHLLYVFLFAEFLYFMYDIKIKKYKYCAYRIQFYYKDVIQDKFKIA